MLSLIPYRGNARWLRLNTIDVYSENIKIQFVDFIMNHDFLRVSRMNQISDRTDKLTQNKNTSLR